MGLPGVETFCRKLEGWRGGKRVHCHVNWMSRAADTWSFSGRRSAADDARESGLAVFKLGQVGTDIMAPTLGLLQEVND